MPATYRAKFPSVSDSAWCRYAARSRRMVIRLTKMVYTSSTTLGWTFRIHSKVSDLRQCSCRSRFRDSSLPVWHAGESKLRRCSSSPIDDCRLHKYRLLPLPVKKIRLSHTVDIALCILRVQSLPFPRGGDFVEQGLRGSKLRSNRAGCRALQLQSTLIRFSA